MFKIVKIKKFIPTLSFMMFILIILIGVISDPSLSFKSASNGISTWFNILLPSLLPFFIISEILIELGFVEFIGKLLSPIMIPMFNISGEGAFPFSMSLISGYPVGAKLACRLREKKIITKSEGNRLISFTSTSGPSFMLAAVSVGMLNNPNIGYLILVPHYLAAISLGLIFSFYKRNKREKIYINTDISKDIKNSYNKMLNTKKPIGSLISKAVKESMDTILLIGGLVIFYSVVVEILFNMKFIDNILSFFEVILSINKDFIKGIVSGVFEITMGCETVASANINIFIKLLGINFIIGWSGLSIHSQVMTFLNKTDLNKGLYLASKFFHGVFSVIFTYIIYIWKYDSLTVPSFLNLSNPYNVFYYTDWLNILISSIKFVIYVNIFILLISLIVYCISNLIKVLFN